MISAVDEALRALVRRDALPDPGLEVVLDAPTRDWAARRNAPTVDLYLYDVREDLRRRHRGLVNELDGAGRVVARSLPPRHFRLSYLATAWTQRPEDEHRLLSALLGCFLRHDALPDDLLPGSLRRLGPVGLTVGLPPPEDRAFADVWSALGGELKPSLDVVAVVPTDTGQRYPADRPVTVPARLDLGGLAGSVPRESRGGRSPAPARPAGSGTVAGGGDRHAP